MIIVIAIVALKKVDEYVDVKKVDEYVDAVPITLLQELHDLLN